MLWGLLFLRDCGGWPAILPRLSTSTHCQLFQGHNLDGSCRQKRRSSDCSPEERQPLLTNDRFTSHQFSLSLDLHFLHSPGVCWLRNEMDCVTPTWMYSGKLGRSCSLGGIHHHSPLAFPPCACADTNSRSFLFAKLPIAHTFLLPCSRGNHMPLASARSHICISF